MIKNPGHKLNSDRIATGIAAAGDGLYGPIPAAANPSAISTVAASGANQTVVQLARLLARLAAADHLKDPKGA